MQSMMINFRNYLVKSIPGMVIKYSSVAKSYETIETKKASDVYIAASLKIDSFLTYSNYTFDVLKKAGFNDSEARQYSQVPSSIPVNRRDAAMLAAREDVLATYVEGNNYYRMLNGMPDVEDIEELWLDEEVYIRHKLEPQPLLELPPSVLIYLEAIGEISVLQDRYPDKKYLEHIGSRKIDIVQARMADNYELLYLPKYNDATSFYRDFCNYYEECREYFMTVIYNQYYVSKYDGYDNYIAFMILTMTINTLVSGVFKSFVSRDFYDVDTIRIFLNSYGIQYDGRFNSLQLKLLTKNLNILLQKKGTDQVLLDIMDLLGYSNFSLMKYYLVKQHKTDETGKPIFVYNTVTDEDGNEQQVMDKSQMYDLYFARAKVGTYNPHDALYNTSKVFKYADITTLDRYWVEDETLVDKLINSQFNCIDTKYMDIEVIYRMHQIVFETTYISRMILDKPETKMIAIDLPNLSSVPVSLFDIITTLICLLCKYYRIKPTLLKSPSKILHVMGFNFKVDFDELRKELKKYPSINPDLLKYINDKIFTSPADVNDMYVHIKNLDVTLVDLMNRTTDIKTYRVLEKLYNTIMWTELTNETFADDNGNIPEYFTDYLQVSSPEIAGLIEKLTPEEASEMIDYITVKLSNTFYDTKFLNYLKIFDTHTFAAILKLLRFFKSYTVDLRDVNMVLMLDSKYYNMIHLASDMAFDDVNLFLPDTNFLNSAIDIINKCKAKVKNKEKVFTKEEMEFLAYIFKSSYMYAEDKIFKMYTEGYDSLLLHMSQMINVADMLKANGLISMKDMAELHEYVYAIETLYMNHIITFNENLKFKSLYSVNSQLSMYDDMRFKLTNKHNESIKLLTNIRLWIANFINQYIKTDEKLLSETNIITKLGNSSTVDLIDSFIIDGLKDEFINFVQTIMMINTISGKDDLLLADSLGNLFDIQSHNSSIETLDLVNRIIPEMVQPDYATSRIKQLYSLGLYHEDYFNLREMVLYTNVKEFHNLYTNTLDNITNIIVDASHSNHIVNKERVLQELNLYKSEYIKAIDYIKSIDIQLIKDSAHHYEEINDMTKQLMLINSIQCKCDMIYLFHMKLNNYIRQFDNIRGFSSIDNESDNITSKDTINLLTKLQSKNTINQMTKVSVNPKIHIKSLSQIFDRSVILPNMAINSFLNVYEDVNYNQFEMVKEIIKSVDLCQLTDICISAVADIKTKETLVSSKTLSKIASSSMLSEHILTNASDTIKELINQDDSNPLVQSIIFPIYKMQSLETALMKNNLNLNYFISELDDMKVNQKIVKKDSASTRDSCVFIWQD